MPKTKTTISRELIVEAMDGINLDGDALREDYSGRSMWGEVCFGIVFDHPGVLLCFGGELIACAADALQNEDLSTDVRYETEALRALLRRVCIDSMGTGVIAYFPGVELVD